VRGQRGFTLVELLLTMTMSLVAAGSGLALLGVVGQRNVENARYSDRVSRAQIALESMTRELRQATWVPVRTGPGVAAVPRLVRFDCSLGTTCERREGPRTSYPPPAAPAFDSTRIAIESLRPGSVVFTPQAVGPSGAPTTTYVNPTTLAVRLEVTIEGWDRPVRLDDTITMRNATTFGAPA
jgi:prepilin-type N-terminal cleavage/methylation domain-containing protein